jgi:enamine deaminase RidA (YjgF/YER057c/UK114 family)
MAGRIEARLAELGLTLPAPAPPVASYVPYVVSGSLVFISGQIPRAVNGPEIRGKLGGALSLKDGQSAARMCAINLLSQLKAACAGDLDRVVRCVKLGGFVNATPEFYHHHRVIDAASDLIVEVFGELGRHARFAAGAPSLPLDAAVEIEAVFEIQ